MRYSVGDTVQRVDNGVACNEHAVFGYCLDLKRGGRNVGRREMLISDRADNFAIHFLRPRLVDAVAAQARFDMAYRDLAVICRKRSDHRGGGIALHYHAVSLAVSRTPPMASKSRAVSASSDCPGCMMSRS